MRRRQSGRTDAFRRDDGSVGAGAQQEVRCAVAADRICPLLRREAVHECLGRRELALRDDDFAAFDAEVNRLSAREHRGEGCIGTEERRVDCEVMPAELQHPGRCRRWLAKERDEEEIATEIRIAAATRTRVVGNDMAHLTCLPEQASGWTIGLLCLAGGLVPCR